jgi:hypothetical protein
MADRTAEFVDFMKNHFVGFRSDQPLTTFRDNTHSVLGVKTGDQIKARGWVQIDSLLHSNGSMIQIDLPVAPFHLWAADVVMVFKYVSQTHGERWVWPGGAFVNNEWDSLHPEGTISIHMTFVPGANGQLGISVTVSPGHDDRANEFIANVARGTAGKADSLIETFTGQSVAVV